MSMNKGTLNEINRVAAEVVALAMSAIAEIDGQMTWERDESTGRYRDVPKYPKGNAPVNETPRSGSITTAALRRRSMDLTRLLAEMRRAN